MKIGSVDISCDFDLSKGFQTVHSPPLNFFTVCWPGFRCSFGVDLLAKTGRGRWFEVFVSQLDDLRVGPRWLVWRMGLARVYWWFGFAVERFGRRNGG